MKKRSLALLCATMAFSGLSSSAIADTKQMQQAIDGKHRAANNVMRDKYRNPLKTLELFDIQPHHTVVEIWPSGGWYTEILAPYLKNDGKYIAAHFDADDKQASYRARSRASFEKKMAENTNAYGKVKINSLMINEKTGENAINVVPGAAGTIDEKMIDDCLPIIKKSKIFLTQLETPKDATFYALKKAKECGATTILNPAPASAFSKDFFKFIDFFTPNETEASFYLNKNIESEKDCREAGKEFLDMGIKNILITLGDKGCFFKNENEEFLVPAQKLNKPVIDTTGAGDAFNGAFCVGLSENKNYKKSIEFASLVAGISVTKEGAANSMPKLNEIKENTNEI